MPSYLELKQQIEALNQQAETARVAEQQAVIAEIRKMVFEFGITSRDIFGRSDARRSRQLSSAKREAPPKYRDPASGATWSGRGRPPRWLTEADQRDAFLIKGRQR